MQTLYNGKKGILFINPCPSKKESQLNKPGIGIASQYLEYVMDLYDIDIKDDCYKINLFDENKSNITDKDLSGVREELLSTIDELKPKVIIPLGEKALRCLIAKRCKGRVSATSIDKWAGWKIPDQHHKCYIVPIWHPLEVIRPLQDAKQRKIKYKQWKESSSPLWLNKQIKENDDYKIKKKYFFEYIHKAINNNSFYVHNYESDVEVTVDVDRAIEILKELNKKKMVAFDYETTGIKPHADGHKILCVSFSDGQVGYSFPMFGDREFRKWMKKLLTNKRVKKTAHNFKYEEIWTREILGYKVERWELDTMLLAHILDCRTGITGLKFQTYINYGVIGYDDAVDKYMKSDDNKNANAFNKLDQIDIRELCKYCALDSLFTYKLAEDLSRQMDPHLWKGYKLFHEGTLALADIEQNGLYIKGTQLLKNQRELETKIFELEEKIYSTEEMKKWDGEEKLNLNSPKQLQHFFFELLEYPPKKKTKTGYSTDKESLEHIHRETNSEVVEYLLEISKYEKLKGTFIDGIRRETIKDFMHPSFNLNTVTSYRSSSSNINFQNLPKRDKVAAKYIRSNIHARPGHRILEFDYGSLEVRANCLYSQDKNLMGYILDDSTDMHRDVARQIFMKDDITKLERFIAKNKFVFAQFYGDWYKACARTIWEDLTTDPALKDTLNHMKRKKIRNLEALEKHLKKIEDDLWTNRFPEHAAWRDKSWKKYVKTGYLESKTGFRYKGVHRRNQIVNYPVQGTGFHMLLFSLIHLNKFLKDGKMESMIIGQIHDSIVMDVAPDEWDIVREEAKRIMTEHVKEHWEWINLPLVVEADLYPIDGDWSEVEESVEI